MDDDKTVMLSPPSVVRVQVQRGASSLGDEEEFTDTFRIGRSPECQVQLDDRIVSKVHAQVSFDAGRWWIHDLESANGTFLEGRRITREPLPLAARLEFGPGGPVLLLRVGGEKELPDQADQSAGKQAAPQSVTEIVKKLKQRVPTSAGEGTMLLRQALGRITKQHSRKYKALIAFVSVCLVASGFVVWKQAMKIHRMKEAASEVFYSIKRIELKIALIEEIIEGGGTPKQKEEIKAERQKMKEMEKQYDKYVEEIGLYEQMSEDKRVIFRMARLFGECDANMPDGFVKEVQRYIDKWKSTERLLNGIRRAESQGYVPKVAEAMQAQNLPPQFFYLALQESNFEAQAVGPSTRFGIAKGIWQFIPPTAQQYGLQIGPMSKQPRYDPHDERYHFEKATVAAAKYLKRLYTTDAQASGLLVMASYNWGEGNVIHLIRQMPENPEERNFWQLLKRFKIPRETYDYVFYIFSAAVIAENPGLFGFTFSNPFPEAPVRAPSRVTTK